MLRRIIRLRKNGLSKKSIALKVGVSEKTVLRYTKNVPITRKRICHCGCGKRFTPKTSMQRFLNKKHKSKAMQKRFRQKHKTTSKHVGYVFCPLCRGYGRLVARWRNYGSYSKIVEFYVQHYIRVYSPAKYRRWRKLGYSSAYITKHLNRYVVKRVKDCHIC